MGSWSTTIMGSDNALDIEGEIFDLLDIEQFPNDGETETKPIDIKAILEEKQVWLLEKLDRNDEIQIQVLGYMLVTAGVKIEQAVKDAIIKGCDDDEWAQNDDERAKYVNQLKDAVITNDGSVPIELTNESLMDKLGEHLRSGNNDLLNK